MTGIVVVYDPESAKEQIRELARVMCHGLQRSEREGPTEQYVGSGLAIGRCRPVLINQAPQPAQNEDGTIYLVFHGELFGHEGLCRSLKQKGHAFSTDSHPEFVIHLYEEKGDAFVQELNGGFALALWDRRQQKLILANDRYGLCPLYHAQWESAYLWASAPKGRSIWLLWLTFCA
jgi:asparagine synthase (glutamine-hydrolysing)